MPVGTNDVLLARTGYTGEDGVELFVSAKRAVELWERILAEAAALGLECGSIGLAARDSLRFEPGFPLYGHELTEETTPIQARLGWACDMEKEFVGAHAIRERAAAGSQTVLATLRLADRGVPRQGHQVWQGDERVGHVASGMYCPTVDAYCANAYLSSQYSRVGIELDVEIRDRRKRAIVVKRPLYRPAYR
jgi:glycine cleavage system aminomethyltransferase T